MNRLDRGDAIATALPALPEFHRALADPSLDAAFDACALRFGYACVANQLGLGIRRVTSIWPTDDLRTRCYSEVVADEYTSEMIAMLERQREHFASDELLVERAEEFRGASATECWEATKELCTSLDWLVARMDPETRERALAPEPLSDEVIAVLEALQKRPPP